MSEVLYNPAILRLATGRRTDALSRAPDGEARRRSPTCGSEMSAALLIGEDGRIDDLRIEVSACAVGQASAAIVEMHASGHDLSELADMQFRLAAYLAGEGELPGDWAELEQLAAVQRYPGRHGAMLLPFDAVVAALEAARAAQEEAR